MIGGERGAFVTRMAWLSTYLTLFRIGLAFMTRLDDIAGRGLEEVDESFFAKANCLIKSSILAFCSVFTFRNCSSWASSIRILAACLAAFSRFVLNHFLFTSSFIGQKIVDFLLALFMHFVESEHLGEVI
ncbi:MAG: hypothetical protein HY717_22050 [Planctomycetes bacterium]|nr:hypothetical protein [Planctomycetota bacterium]